MSPFQMSRRRGFSLIELVVVVALIGLLIGLLVPRAGGVREIAERTTTINNLRQVGVAAHGAHDTYKKMPPFYGWYAGKLAGVHAHLLPYIEGNNIYQQFHGDALRNASQFGAFIPYTSPLDPSTPDGVFPGTNIGTTNFLCNTNAFWFTGTSGNGWAVGLQRMPASYLNGTSCSVFLVTAVGDASATADGAAAGNVPGNHNYSSGHAHFPNLSPVNALPEVATPAPGATTKHSWAPPTAANYPVPVILNRNDTGVWRQPVQLTPAGTQVCMGDASTRTVSPDVAQATWGMVCVTWQQNAVPADWNQ